MSSKDAIYGVGIETRLSCQTRSDWSDATFPAPLLSYKQESTGRIGCSVSRTWIAYSLRRTRPFQKSKLFSSLCKLQILPVPRPSLSVSSTRSMPQSRVMPSTRALTPPSASSDTACPVCSQCR